MTGYEPACPPGCGAPARIALDRAGWVIPEKRLPQILTSWDRLQRLLRETIDERHYHLGQNFERVEQDGSGVLVHFTGDRREHADILIACWSANNEAAPVLHV